jgi:sugar phosphate permease
VVFHLNTGLVSSSQNLAYTISKFCGGVLSDNISAKMMFAVGLFFSGLLTVSLTGRFLYIFSCTTFTFIRCSLSEISMCLVRYPDD